MGRSGTDSDGSVYVRSGAGRGPPVGGSERVEGVWRDTKRGPGGR